MWADKTALGGTTVLSASMHPERTIEPLQILQLSPIHTFDPTRRASTRLDLPITTLSPMRIWL